VVLGLEVKTYPHIIHSLGDRVRAYDETGTPIFDAKGSDGASYIKGHPEVPYYPDSDFLKNVPYVGIKAAEQWQMGLF